MFVLEANFGEIRFWDSHWVTYDNTLSLCKIVHCHSHAGFFFINQTKCAAEGEKLCTHICTLRLLSFWTLTIIQYLKEHTFPSSGERIGGTYSIGSTTGSQYNSFLWCHENRCCSLLHLKTGNILKYCVLYNIWSWKVQKTCNPEWYTNTLFPEPFRIDIHTSFRTVSLQWTIIAFMHITWYRTNARQSTCITSQVYKLTELT